MFKAILGQNYLTQLAHDFGIHELFYEDVANMGPKAEIEIKKTKFLSSDPGPTNWRQRQPATNQVLFLMKNTVIYFVNGQF